MSSCVALWEGADRFWNLELLIQDLELRKERKLTLLENRRIRCALLGATLKEVAEHTSKKGCTVRSLGVYLVRGLYRYIEGILADKEIETEISWQQIPRLLDKAGYRRPSSLNVNESLEAISPNKPNIRALDIIADIEQRIYQIRKLGANLNTGNEVIDELVNNGDLATERGDYTSAIVLYKNAILNDPSRLCILGKIASCYEHQYHYADSVELSLWALGQVQNDFRRQKKYTDLVIDLNGILGSAFHELALKYKDKVFLRQALMYYDASIHGSNRKNILGSWNGFELSVRYSLISENGDLASAKNRFFFFQELIDKFDSNFSNLKYRKRIIHDAKNLLNKIIDAELHGDLNAFIQYHC